MTPVRTSLLDAEHRALDARMTPFGGWEMPLQYQGVLDEHTACRNDAVVFDVSHLGSVRVTGAGALDGLQALFTNDLTKIGPGRAQYTHLLDPVDAHVVDDIIVWWLADDDFLVIPNASNTEPAFQAMAEVVGESGVVDVTADRAFLAVQGPNARKYLADALPAAAEVGRFRVATCEVDATEIIVGGTGYTGEDGVELFVPAEAAVPVWRTLVDAGLQPAGLGARDTLRLEMGYPLHGHELGEGITPLQAGLDWVVAWDKSDFRGKGPLEGERSSGVSRHLTGIVMEGRRIPREACAVLVDGEERGVVTSGNFSPVLERGIALAFVPPDVDPGSPVEVVIRDKKEGGNVTEPPFVERP